MVTEYFGHTPQSILRTASDYSRMVFFAIDCAIKNDNGDTSNYQDFINDNIAHRTNMLECYYDMVNANVA